MSNKSWHLPRRSFLMGTGVSLALPWLDCMAETATEAKPARRFCAFYFGFGVGLPKEDGDQAQWRWFPNGQGKEFEFTEVLRPLEQHRDRVTILGGLSHPEGRRMGGHDTGDTFLTGAYLNNKMLRNTVSLDQVIAQHWNDQTRFPSLVLSTDGGVGEPTRSSTLSYDRRGRPIPALHQPQQIFDRFFADGDADAIAQRRRIRSAASMLDKVLEDSKSLRRKLGRRDQEKMDEYLSSVREIEQRVERSQRWIEVPRPDLTDEERDLLKLDADDQAPKDFIRTMYDLIYLAFKTDSTRVATYQITNMADCSSKAAKFPQLEGFKKTLHSLAHDWNKPGGAEELGKWDRFMAEQLSYFLGRLSSASDEQGTLLDNSLVLYGSSNSITHNNKNYPLVLAGGNGLGVANGQFLKLDEKTPLSNLYATVLHRLGVESERFADSTGELTELLV